MVLTRGHFGCLFCVLGAQNTENWAVALQRMPLLSRVTMQKGAKGESKGKPIVSAHLKKKASAPFTLAERVAGCRPGRSEPSRVGGLVFVWLTHTLLPFQEQKFIF